MATEKSIKANNIVTLAEGENANLSFGSADIKGMVVGDAGELVITLNSGDTLTITNFKSLAQQGATLTLADGSTLQTTELYQKLAQDMPALTIETPADNAVVTYNLEPGQKYNIIFDRTGTEKIEQKDGALVITFDNNAQIVLNGYEGAIGADPAVEINFNGEFLTVQEFAEALRLATLIDENMEARNPDEQLADIRDVNREAAEMAKVEPAAGDMAQTAEQLAQIEPAAGDAGSAAGGSAGGFGFQSSVDAAPLNPLDAIGPIGPTALQFGLPEFRDEVRGNDRPAPVPPGRPGIEAQNELVYEDGSVTLVVLGTSNGDANVQMTITIGGIPNGWTVVPNGGSYNPANGTVTYTLPAGTTNFAGGPTLSPPADSDEDIPTLTITATNTDTTTGLSSSTTTTISVTTDAVADEPEIVANDDIGQEDEVLDVVVNTSVTDTDGSETITSIVITGIPLGFTLSAGVQDPVTGTWTLTPAQLAGLKVTPPTDFVGIINAVATSTATETNKSGDEFDTTNDTATKSDEFTLTWLPNPPTIDIDFPPNHGFDANNALVKEDGTVNVIVNAALRSGHGPDEVLTVTVTGIDPAWGFNPNGVGTYTPATGTWTVTLPPGTNLMGHALTFSPPANSDIDLTGLTATSSAYVPATDTTLTDSEGFGIVVDAVADVPTVTAENAAGNENTALPLDIEGLLGVDTDGSESITGYEISGVPDGYTFNQGTNLGGGVWSFTPAQVTGLTISSPTNFHGSIPLVAKVLTADTPNDLEADTADNTNSATDPFTVTWRPLVDTPNILVNNGVDNAIVKEDGSIGVPVVANLGAGHSPNEVLTVTVTGINPAWGFSAPVGTYTAAIGTWTVTLPPGTNLSTVLTFSPPANSDLDLSGLVATASAYEPATATTATATDGFGIITDAVADAPTLGVTNATTEEGRTIPLTITTAVTDTDGSEIIETVTIAGVPATATLSAGVKDPVTGVWTLTPAQLPGLTVTIPDGTTGVFNLTVTSTAFDQNTATTGANIEDTTADNRASTTQTLVLTVRPDDVPTLGTPRVVTVDETDLAGAPSIGATSTVTANFGADTPGTYVVNGGFFSGTPLFSNGVAVTVAQSGNGYVGTTPDGTVVFTLTLNTATGQFTYTQPGTLDHPDTTDADDNIALQFGFNAVDSEGDLSPNGVITVNVRDDGPVANNDVNSYQTNAGPATGNVMTGLNGGAGAADVASQDEVTTVTQVRFGTTTVNVPETGTVTINGSYGALTIASDGSYSYTLFPAGPTGGVVTVDPHEFNETLTFPSVTAGVGISGSTLNNLGVNADALTVSGNGAGTVTFLGGGAGYKNTLGMYTVAADGTLQSAHILIKDGNAPGSLGSSANFAASAGESIGFFIVADGGTANNNYAGIDLNTGTLNFIYGYGTAGERPATVNDNGANVKLVYTSSTGAETVLNGAVYHTTERGGSESLNADGSVRVVSGLAQAGNETTLRIGFEDLPQLGDRDYEDVIFDVTYTATTVTPAHCPEDVFTYVVTDGDGDTDTATLTLDGICPPVDVNLDVGPTNGGNAQVKEDGSVLVPVVATYTGGNGNETMTLTLSGVPGTWGVNAPGWTKVGANWTITLAPGDRDFTGGVTLTPPANSDIDLTTLSVTANVTGPDFNDNGSATDGVLVVVDAVADKPTIVAVDRTGAEGTPLNVTMNAGLTDNDGSEIITGYRITGVPQGFTFNVGTNAGNGTWTFTPQQIAGLKITPPSASYNGKLDLQVTVLTTENPVSDGEYDTTDNNNSATDTMTLVWTPVINPPSIAVNNGVDNAQVKEDGSVNVAIRADLGASAAPGEFLTVTVTGINSAWGFTPPAGGTYNAAAGTWTITLAAGQNLNGVMRFVPPANSDIDLTGLNATVVSRDPATGQTASANDGFGIVVDAVADKPTITVTDRTGSEGTVMNVTINAALTDNDGSELITGYEITGVPQGFTFNAGTNAGNGKWTFTPQQIEGLKLTPPSNTYNGKLDLQVKVLNTENPVSDGEYDTADNNNSATDTLTLTWTPVIKPPSITVNGGADKVIVKEDSFVNVSVKANLGANPAPGEFLTVTVSGINSAWAVSSPAGGTYNAAAGTWTITLAAGQNLDTVLRFAPPANSDVDLNGLTATVVARDPATGQTANASDGFYIVTDAVIDTPTLTVTNTTMNDGSTVALNIGTNTGETADGSESITKVTISGLPTGATLNKGTVSGGVWTLSKADLAGLTITVPNSAQEKVYDLTVTTYAAETKLSGIEVDTTDNSTSVSKTLKLTVNDDDRPDAKDDYVTFVPTTAKPGVDGNVITNDTLSLDNPNTISKITFGGTTLDVTAGGTTINGTYGKLVIKADGTYTYTLNNPNQYGADKADQFTYTLRDGDGDVDTALLKITTVTPDLIVGKNVPDKDDSTTDHHIGGGHGKIVGGAASDILVGDIGGSSIVNRDKDYNFVLVLDTSGSMGDEKDPGSRLSLLVDAVENLLTEFNSYEGGVIRVHIVPFNTNTGATGTFTVTDNAQLTSAIAYLNTLKDAGYTNYEAALQAAIKYLNGSLASKPLVGAETYTYFISDGEPNYYLNDSGQVVTNTNVNNSMNQIRGVGDSTNEIAQLKALSTVIGVGIDITAGNLARIAEIDSDGKALNIDDARELTQALSGLSPLNQLSGTGDDVLSGGDGNDVIFGDSVNTDVLAVAQGLSTAPGSGWTVFDKLEAGQGTNKAWSRTTTIEYIKNNLAELGRESFDSEGKPRTGGNDTISGGNGDDTIFGQNGNDTIDAGAGNDWVDGGSGNDTIRGGAGNDFIDGGAGDDTLYGDDGNDIIYGWTGNDTIYGGAGNDDIVGEAGADTLYGGAGADKFWYLNMDAGKHVDTIKDFSVAQGDQLELSELLDGHYNATQDAINDFVFSRVVNGSTIISVDLNGSGNAANAVDIAKLEGLSTTLQNLLNSNSVITT